MKRLRTINLEWVDSASPGRPWLLHSEAINMEPPTLVTRAFLVHRDREKVTICHTQGKALDDPDRCGILTIPRGCIIRMKVGK